MPPQGTTPSPPDNPEPDPDAPPFKLAAWLDALGDDGRVSEGLAAVLHGLAPFANNATGRCWPGHANIARRLHLHDGTVRRWIAEARRLGYLALEARARGNQYGGRAAEYRLTMPPSYRAPARDSGDGATARQRAGADGSYRATEAELPRAGARATARQRAPNSQELSENSQGRDASQNPEGDPPADAIDLERDDETPRERTDDDRPEDARTPEGLDRFRQSIHAGLPAGGGR